MSYYGNDDMMGDHHQNGMDFHDDDDHAMMGELDNQEDAWHVIRAYFKKMGLVSQQLDSFNVFMKSTVQEMVDETPAMTIRHEMQHRPGGEQMISEEEEQVWMLICCCCCCCWFFCFCKLFWLLSFFVLSIFLNSVAKIYNPFFSSTHKLIHE